MGTDPFLESADHITPTGDAVFKGECNEIYVVHTSPLREGKLFSTGGVSVMINRSATREEYMERCPQVPALGLRKHYFFYLGTVVNIKVPVCRMIEGEDMAHCPLTDTVLSSEEFRMYACVDRCNLEKACL